MAKRVTQSKVMVEELPSAQRRLTQAKVMVEEHYEHKFHVTKAVIMVEYVVDLRRKSSVPVQMF